ncbi:cellulose binding domain-containing protein [Tautonia marina]|uniref:cellulose binding domain-containing protein n=1 Tax=Tautonia marina TaxID=2653855 RepID=UPI0013761DC5|nr:cellulose binding domain-containing protein [Tautonia marina]
MGRHASNEGRLEWSRSEGLRARGLAGQVEVMEPRTLLSGFRASYEVVQDWGSGLQAEITIENTTGQAIRGWVLEFDYPGMIDSLWNGTFVRQEGGRYSVMNPTWNDTIPSGRSVSFGFVARPGEGIPASGFSLNGTPMEGDSTPQMPAISVGDVRVIEGDGAVRFVVSLDRAGAEVIRVDYGTGDGTATAGSDYVSTSGTLTFAPGEVVKEVVVAILDDDLVEGEEAFRLSLAGPVGASLARAEGLATVGDNDVLPPPPVSGDLMVTYRVTQDWGSGFQGELTLSNQGETPVEDWSFAFAFDGTINSLWDGRIVSQDGNRFTVTHAGWNGTIAAGGEARIGFTASPGGGSVAPYGFSIDSDGGIEPGANRVPVAIDDTVVVRTGNPIRVNVLANDTDPDGDRLVVASVEPPANGSVVVNQDGTITYASKDGFVGTDHFAYVVSDGRGGEATGTVSVTVLDSVPIEQPSRRFDPYVDMTLFPTYNLAETVQTQGVTHFSLAFIVADAQNRPSWGGYEAYAINGSDFDLGIRAQLAQVRRLGGDVTVSFGGANGRELAEAITEVNALKDAYRSVVDAYDLTSIDLDIEGAALAHRTSVDRRSEALASLQQELAAEGRRLDIWLTLPVLPSGLTPDGVYVVQSALNRGVDLAGVNVMAMNYGGSAAPNPDGKTGDYAIMAAQSLHGQLRNLYGPSLSDEELWGKVGLTPMIGRNDVVTEVFDQQEAREVVAFAREVGVGRLSFWSLHRDRENPNGVISYVEPTSSSIEQDPYEFTRIFLDYLN